jgi:hypothetical protein
MIRSSRSRVNRLSRDTNIVRTTTRGARPERIEDALPVVEIPLHDKPPRTPQAVTRMGAPGGSAG